MTFTTLTFCVFLAVTFSVYWLLGERKRQNHFLLVASYFFYGWWDWRFCGLMLLSSVADYAFALGLEVSDLPRRRKLVVAASCVFNLTLLGFFKYFNFFAESAQYLLQLLGWRPDIVTLRVILPVGISFYTFQSMSYIIDVYRKEIKPTRDLLDYMTYVSLFPQLVAGPIQRARHLLPQVLSPRAFDYSAAVDGLRLMLWGAFKKMALADNLAMFVDRAYGNPAAFSGAKLAFATVAFAFQIYCDFSGYSDIAIGTASLFGFRLTRNFAFPYFSQSVPEFWRRWHIALSTWFRDYLFIPLGGNRVSTGRHIFNILTTFVVSGLWHGASWTFVIWGALNGLAMLPMLAFKPKGRLSATDVPGGESWLPAPAVLGRMLLTFAFACLAWVFFRARTFEDALQVLWRIIRHPFAHPLGSGFAENVGTKTMLLLIVIFVVVEWTQRRYMHPLQFQRWPAVLRWAAYTALIWLTLYLAPLQTGGFIYFQF